MTPEEAIRDLQARVNGELYIKGIDKCEDIKLGIEALKLNVEMREAYAHKLFLTLPSETKE